MNNENIIGHKTDYEGAKIGMWIFLFTEMVLFSGLFLLYSAYRSRYPEEFHSAASELNRFMGTFNTVILLTSSLTMALSINSIRTGRKGMSLLLQSLTSFMGLIFLVNKYIEWSAKISHGIYPDSPGLMKYGKGEIIFYGLYYLLTGIHGLHVLAGIVLIAVMIVLTNKDRVSSGRFVALENTGLYWHFVDIIWVFLFPLFYLIS
ncbi:MAG: cytochrome c oxidase subunit 3 family protein [Nitrospiraceae bacterium]|nr:MAG: cytochrome c oxidase subunit 3 family protein [Nitrospiraceae bacterium]